MSAFASLFLLLAAIYLRLDGEKRFSFWLAAIGTGCGILAAIDMAVTGWLLR
jgi:hypothetical protein